MNNKIPFEILDAINNDKLVIFVGAGLSINCKLPSWKRLVEDLLIEKSDYIEKSEALLSAMQSEIMTPLSILDRIENEKSIIYTHFEQKLFTTETSQLHSSLGRITRKFVTTNFDSLIENSTKINSIITQDSSYNLSKIDTEDEFVLKIHGDINRLDSCIIFTSQYNKLYNDETFSTFQLKKIFSTYTVLFIGFSFTDPYITNLFDKIINLQDDFGPKHFFISNIDNDIRNIDDRKIGKLQCINIKDYDNLSNYIDTIISHAEEKIEKSNLIDKTDNTEKESSPTLLKEIDGSDIAPNVTGWVGREDELATLNSDAFRVIIITGIGGGGKSALASHYLQTQSNFEISEWKDFKEQDHKFQHKMVSMIRRLNISIPINDLIDLTDSELVNIFFKELGMRKAVFVLDNIDSYIDLENFEPVNGIGELFNMAMSTEHNSKFIFTCRPFIQYAKPKFMQLNLTGLTEENTIEYFLKSNVGGISKTNLAKYARKSHELTKGHALWLSLILAQSRKGEKALTEFLGRIGTGIIIHQNDTSILSKNVLSSVWDSLHTRDKQLLRILAESVVAETEDDYSEILRDELNYKNFQKALKSLRNFNLIIEKRDSKYIELHPLVKEFVIKNYPPTERTKYISYFVKYYDKWVVVLKEKMSAKLSFQEFSYFTNKAELFINARDYQNAVGSLIDVQDSMCSAGYVEEYLRVAKLLFDAITWSKNAFSKLSGIEDLIHRTAKASTEFGFFAFTELLLSRYDAIIEKKEENYIRLCDMKSYYYWFKQDYSEAINTCEQALYLLERAKQPDLYSIKHTLALSQRDSKNINLLGKALDFFIKDHSLEDMLDLNTLPEINMYSTLGNVGKCLYLQKKISESLICYSKSFFQLFEKYTSDNLLNLGYASFWIAESLSDLNEKESAYYFFKHAFNCWSIISPVLEKRHRSERTELENKIYLNISSQEDWRVEKYCVQWIENKLSRKLTDK